VAGSSRSPRVARAPVKSRAFGFTVLTRPRDPRPASPRRPALKARVGPLRRAHVDHRAVDDLVTGLRHDETFVHRETACRGAIGPFALRHGTSMPHRSGPGPTRVRPPGQRPCQTSLEAARRQGRVRDRVAGEGVGSRVPERWVDGPQHGVALSALRLRGGARRRAGPRPATPPVPGPRGSRHSRLPSTRASTPGPAGPPGGSSSSHERGGGCGSGPSTLRGCPPPDAGAPPRREGR